MRISFPRNVCCVIPPKGGIFLSLPEDNSGVNLIDENAVEQKTADNISEKPKKNEIGKAVYDFISKSGELFFSALVKLGTLFVHGILHIIAAILRGFDRIKKYLVRFFKRVWEIISAPFIRYYKAFKVGSAEISRKNREEGRKTSFGAFARFFGKAIFGKRGLAVTLFNYALPIVSCVFLVNIIAYATSMTYALKLTVNGNFVGYIADETVYSDAEQMLQDRINYTGTSTDVVTFTPAYEVDMVGYGSTLSTYQVTDRMLQLLDKQIEYGFGVYIGDAYYGTLYESKRAESTLESLLDKYRTDNPKETVVFEKDIQFVPGLYLADSFVNEDSLLSLLTSNRTVAAYYTVVEGDSPSTIVSKTGMSYDELARLNPGFSKNSRVYVGDKYMINQDEPYLNVIITREEHYNEVIAYDTEYTTTNKRFKDDRWITTNGVNGESAVVANVSYINGVEVGRSVLSRVTLKSPVTQVIAVGTMERPTVAASASTTEAGKLIWPLPQGVGKIGYGWGGYPGHTGQDILAPYGTPIFAGDSGVITEIYYEENANYLSCNGGYGNLVVITHDNGMKTYYAHCSAIADIYVGQRVTAGENIAFVGSTGRSYGNHVHVEVHIGGRKVDPTPYLPI